VQQPLQDQSAKLIADAILAHPECPSDVGSVPPTSEDLGAAKESKHGSKQPQKRRQPGVHKPSKRRRGLHKRRSRMNIGFVRAFMQQMPLFRERGAKSQNDVNDQFELFKAHQEDATLTWWNYLEHFAETGFLLPVSEYEIAVRQAIIEAKSWKANRIDPDDFALNFWYKRKGGTERYPDPLALVQEHGTVLDECAGWQGDDDQWE
jgi:hypothetical protein